jgi:dihydropteroate synthase
MLLRLPFRCLRFPRRPLIMGIVNVNDDSFSGDGTLDLEEALQFAAKQAAAGADVIDVGAESARTNRDAIPVAEEVARFGGFMERWGETISTVDPVDAQQVWPPVLSANTWRPEVVEAVLEMGAEMINDLGGLPTARNARLAAEHGAALLVMHTIGVPKIPQTEQQWPDVGAELDRFFREKLALAQSAGLSEEQLVLDPGIDFAKQCADNLRVLKQVDRLAVFERPVLLPISRKTVIGDVLGIEEPTARDAGTIGLLASGILSGAQIFRVHDVAAGWQAAKVLWAVVRRGK